MSIESNSPKPIFATYNIGRKEDFGNLQHTFTKSFTPEQVAAQRSAQAIAANNIPKMASAIALQDGVNLERPEVKALQDHRFTVITSGDLGIALDTTKYSDITDASFEEKSLVAAIAIAKDNSKPPKTIAFISIQVQGYHLEDSTPTMDTDGYTVAPNVPPARESGELATKIKEITTKHSCDQVFVGGDLNTNKDLSKEHFTPWENLGFTTLSPQEKTNITKNPDFATNMQDRKLDHIFIWEKPTWSNLPSRISRFFFGESRQATTQGSFRPNFNPAKAASDHVPVYLSRPEESGRNFLQRQWDYLFGSPKTAASEDLTPADLETRLKIEISINKKDTKTIDSLKDLGFWFHREDLSSEGRSTVSLPAGRSRIGNKYHDEEQIPRVIYNEANNTYLILDKSEGKAIETNPNANT